jgi:small subunit ribosomal protein S8
MVSATRKFSSNVSDPVADLLTRIRNANLAYKDELITPVSKLNEAVLAILTAEGYVGGFEKEGEGVQQAFRVRLKYGKGRQRTITGLRRVSTPGRRVYTGRYKLPRVLGGLGIAIVSTSQGVMTDRDASRRGIGGEVLAYVW